MTLKLAIPSKGRLKDKAFAWFKDRGLTLESDADARAYRVTSGMPDLQVLPVSAGEIPRELGAGTIHLGVTGIDVVREKVLGWRTDVREIYRMGFGRADLVVAVPDFWVDCQTIADLDAVAGDFRAQHGRRLRIATKYHRLVREFLRDQGVADYQLVDSQGATEATVRHRSAEAVADITSTGDTLRANHLRILTDGLILKSEAVLFQSRVAPMDDAARGVLDRLLTTLGIEAPRD